MFSKLSLLPRVVIFSEARMGCELSSMGSVTTLLLQFLEEQFYGTHDEVGVLSYYLLGRKHVPISLVNCFKGTIKS